MKVINDVDLSHIGTEAKDCFNLMRGSRIFLTGGTGFFGIWLLSSILWANRYLNAQLTVSVLSRDPETFLTIHPHLKNQACLTFIKGDVCYFDFPPGEFDYLIHGATKACDVLNQQNPLLMFSTITDGTKRALAFAQKAKVKSFLLLSSGAIYGKQPSELSHVSENFLATQDHLSPTGAYAMGKLMAEHLGFLSALQNEMNFKIARCFAFVGPFLPLETHFAIGNFIRDVLNRSAITIKGDGTPYRSYLYAADLVIWLFKILVFGKNQEAYNVGSDEAINIIELARVISTMHLPALPIVIEKEPRPNHLAARYVPQVSKIQKELGVKVWIPLAEAISKTISWNQTYAKG